MKIYTGTKTINAMPMNRADYNASRGWKLPSNENGADTGYLIEYLEGSASSASAFSGYVTWLPTEQFDKMYIQVCTTDRMPPHMVRVAAEHAELTHKLEKLNVYIDGKMFDYLAEHEQMALLEQQVVMREYAAILATRLRN